MDLLRDWAPTLGVLAALVVVLTLTSKLTSGIQSSAERNLPRQLSLLGITMIGIVLIVLSTPLEIELRGQLLSLLGLAFTAVIALSSQTFVANMMAGLMLRSVRSFKSGDFVRVGESFGRVTERGLFHTEIQTEDRDLVTLPNLYLVTNPVKVVRTSGTVITASLSLGYDVPQDQVRDLLGEAAAEIGLTDAYVHLEELGDFSVTYKVAGFLEDVERVITTRSRLRSAVLDALHEAGVEIVSPTFMNQRQFQAGDAFIPKVQRRVTDEEDEAVAENVGFDKAVKASDIEKHEETLAEVKEELEACSDADEKAALEARVTELEEQLETARARLDEEE